jgi:hypothetical protein
MFVSPRIHHFETIAARGNLSFTIPVEWAPEACAKAGQCPLIGSSSPRLSVRLSSL